MNIAMLGSGFIGRFYADSLQGYRSKDKVVTIYSRKEESAKKFAKDYNVGFATASMEAAIKSGADVNVTVEGLGPPIVITALGDNLSGVQLLLDRGANINAEDSEGYTALINASFSNNPDMVRLLLSKGVNVNAPSNLMVNGKKAGFTPMMIAKSKGHQEIVKLLMEAGAKK